MVESIRLVQQMMTESKFVEAQKYSEELLKGSSDLDRLTLIPIYLESLQAQSKKLPTNYLLELSEKLVSSNIEQAKRWLDEVPEVDQKRYLQKYLICKSLIAEKKGLTADLYNCISELQIYLYELNVPSVPQVINELVDRYYKQDFNLKLQRLAHSLLLKDIERTEILLNELLQSCVEKSSPKGVVQKYQSIKEVLATREDIEYLEIYRDLISILTEGITEKKSFKRLAEVIIYFDDFKMQTLLLHLLDKLSMEYTELKSVAESYAKAVRTNKDYDFVYFDKYFVHLKKYFVSLKEKEQAPVEEPLLVDLTLDGKIRSLEKENFVIDDSVEGEQRFLQLLKHGSYKAEELNEIAVSFLQSHMPRVALGAVELALKEGLDGREYLKASYLKLTCLLLMGDYRSVLDVSLEALNKATEKEDILSFLYGQAEAWIKLDNKKEAQRVLKKIISIDSQYRLAKERLEKINEL